MSRRVFEEDQRVRHIKSGRIGFVERTTPRMLITVRWDDAVRASAVESYSLEII